MVNTKNGKFSAILFADIIGYTILVQSNKVIDCQQVEKFQ